MNIMVGVIHKPRGQLRGRGISKMTILLHKPYLVKLTMKWEGVKNTQKLPRGLWMTPGTQVMESTNIFFWKKGYKCLFILRMLRL